MSQVMVSSEVSKTRGGFLITWGLLINISTDWKNNKMLDCDYWKNNKRQKCIDKGEHRVPSCRNSMNTEFAKISSCLEPMAP